MTALKDLTLPVSGWGTARANLASIAAQRKQLPPWAPADTPGHFLKYADEHTIVAIAAVDRAIRHHELDPRTLNDWAIIAAPRWMGRLAGVAALQRFARGGGPALSPHLIPQHSLHSVSGALSILLASRRPNLGLGGGADALTEGLLAALTLPLSPPAAGVWLVATAWDVEPICDDAGNCANTPVCYAAAVALSAAPGATALGQLRLTRTSDTLGPYHSAGPPPLTLPQLCQSLDELSITARHGLFRWSLPGGAGLVLSINAAAAQLSAAA
jgi:hypothetical protein